MKLCYAWSKQSLLPPAGIKNHMKLYLGSTKEFAFHYWQVFPLVQACSRPLTHCKNRASSMQAYYL